MPVCSDDTSKANIEKRRDKKRRYFDVQVRSWRRENGKILIEAPTVRGDTDIFEIPWGNEIHVWPFCPSTLLSDGGHRTPVPLPDQASGVVHLHETFIDAARGKKTGAKMLGGGTKWPVALPGPDDLFTREVPIMVHHLLLNANERVEGAEPGASGDVDLTKRELAPVRTLDIVDGPMEVELTREGCRAIGAAEGELDTRVVPVTVHRLLLKGTERIDDGVSNEPGEVDLMTRTDAPRQLLEIGDGPIMRVRLTRQGCTNFTVDFPDLLYLRAAFMVLRENKDPTQVAIARSVVAACKAVLDAGRWEADSKKWGGTLGPDAAAKLVADVSEP